jgi:hypothetical protein
MFEVCGAWGRGEENHLKGKFHEYMWGLRLNVSDFEIKFSNKCDIDEEKFFYPLMPVVVAMVSL